MLKLKNVSANIDTTEVLKNIDLTINPGEIHAIMGPRRSGKSTLAHVIQGNPFISIGNGTVQYKGKSINKVPAHRRSLLGIYTSFQHPPDIESISNSDLLVSLITNARKTNFTTELENAYLNLVKAIGLDRQFLEDPVNTQTRDQEDHKKSEILQMIMLQPEIIILDEIDANVTDEALSIMTIMIKNYLETGNKSLVLITNNHKFLDLLTPQYVHVLVDGEIRERGSTELYKRIIEDGYSQFS